MCVLCLREEAKRERGERDRERENTTQSFPEALRHIGRQAPTGTGLASLIPVALDRAPGPCRSEALARPGRSNRAASVNLPSTPRLICAADPPSSPLATKAATTEIPEARTATCVVWGMVFGYMGRCKRVVFGGIRWYSMVFGKRAIRSIVLLLIVLYEFSTSWRGIRSVEIPLL